MKSIVLSIVLVPCLAAADPAPSAYVQATGLAGLFVAGGAIEGGYHLGNGAWAHGEAVFATAGFSEVNDWTGPMAQLRAGIEGRRCTRSHRWCGVVGVDLGAQRFHGSYYDSNANMPDTTVYGAVAAVHAGLDVGGEHVRFRAGVESAVFAARLPPRSPSFYLAATAGVAYQW